MFWYVVKLLVLLPLIGLMIWGSLKLAQRMQGKFGAPQGGTKAVRVVETTMLSPTTSPLAVNAVLVEQEGFGGVDNVYFRTFIVQ